MRDNRGDVLAACTPWSGKSHAQIGTSPSDLGQDNAGTTGNNIESCLSGQGAIQIEVFDCFMSANVNFCCGACRKICDATFSAPIKSPIHFSAFRRLTAKTNCAEIKSNAGEKNFNFFQFRSFK